MARGIGTLTVSVQANTAKAVKNLRDFRSEAKQTGADARKMSADFRGNTLADYQSRFGPKPDSIRKSSTAVTDFQHSLVDLRNDTDRYTGSAAKQVGMVKQLNGAMNQLKAAAKAAAVSMVALQGFNFGQKLRGHIEYVHSWADAWREFKSAVTGSQSGLDIEMEKLARQQERGEARLAKIQADADKTASLEEDRAASKAETKRALDVAMFGEKEVLYREDLAKYGAATATYNAANRDALQTLIDQKAAAEAKEEARRKKEIEHQEKLRKDALELQRVREKARKDAMDYLKQERGTLAGRTGQDSAMLDARTSEGWAALRNSVRSAELEKLDEQIAVLKMIEGKVGAPPKQEVFTL